MYSKPCSLTNLLLVPPLSSAPHRSSQWIRAGCRAAAGGGGSHGPQRLGWMAAPPCCSVLGSGKETGNTGNTHKCFWQQSCDLLLLMLLQMHVAELLVSHGAGLNAKTFLEETPIGIFTPQRSYQYTWWEVKKTNVSLGMISFHQFVLFKC